jgi:hypothetical protein
MNGWTAKPAKPTVFFVPLRASLRAPFHRASCLFVPMKSLCIRPAANDPACHLR